jgi:hypothetical protein
MICTATKLTIDVSKMAGDCTSSAQDVVDKLQALDPARWLPGAEAAAVKGHVNGLIDDVAKERRVGADFPRSVKAVEHMLHAALSVNSSIREAANVELGSYHEEHGFIKRRRLDGSQVADSNQAGCVAPRSGP